MSYPAPGGASAAKYQEMRVLSATPGELVVIVYDHLLGALRRAAVAATTGDVEVRNQNLDAARAAVGELLCTLDRERGGAVAEGLASLYAFFLGQLVDVGGDRDTRRLERITSMVTDLREAFAQAAQAAPHANVA